MSFVSARRLHLLLCAIFVAAACRVAAAADVPAEALPSGTDVMDRIEHRADPAQRTESLTIQLIEPDGTSRERTARVFRARKEGEVRILFVFDSPPNIRGTALLIVDYDDPGRDDDRWIYLPALRKTRRIGAGERGQTFLGTDFTYEEIRNDARLKSSEMNLAVSAAGEHEGRPCIQSRLHVTSESYAHDLGYNDIDACVDRESWIPTTMKMFGADGKGVKSIELAKLSNVQGTWVPMHREAVSAEGHRTVLETTAVDVVTSIPDDYFTEDGLQRGGH